MLNNVSICNCSLNVFLPERTFVGVALIKSIESNLKEGLLSENMNTNNIVIVSKNDFINSSKSIVFKKEIAINMI